MDSWLCVLRSTSQARHLPSSASSVIKSNSHYAIRHFITYKTLLFCVILLMATDQTEVTNSISNLDELVEMSLYFYSVGPLQYLEHLQKS